MANRTARAFTSVMTTCSLGLNDAIAIPTAPYPQPMSRTQPFSGKIMDSMSNLVPLSTFRFEKTLDAVKNSKDFPQRHVRTSPKRSWDLGVDEKSCSTLFGSLLMRSTSLPNLWVSASWHQHTRQSSNCTMFSSRISCVETRALAKACASPLSVKTATVEPLTILVSTCRTVGRLNWHHDKAHQPLECARTIIFRNLH